MSKSIQTIPGKAYTISFSKPGNVIATGPEGQSLTLLSVNCAQQASFIAISRDSILSDDAAVVLPVLGSSNSSVYFTSDQRNDLLWYVTKRCTVEHHLDDKNIHLQSGERDKWNKTGSDLSAHCKNTSVHLQSGERDKWNAAASCVSKHAADLGWLASNKSTLSSMQSAFSSGALKGEKGCKGCRGAKGDKGCKGAKGCKGDPGSSTGVKGDKGCKGCKGCRGEKGCKGDPGSGGGSLDLCAETTGNSTRLGMCTHTNGSTDIAIGMHAFSDAQAAISIGTTSHVCGSGQGGIAIGWQARVMGVGSIAIGEFSRTCSCRSLAIGQDAHALAYDASAIGRLAENRLDRTLLLTVGGGSTGQLDVYLIAANSDISNCSILNGCAGIAWKTAHASGIKKLSELIGTNGFLTCL